MHACPCDANLTDLLLEASSLAQFANDLQSLILSCLGPLSSHMAAVLPEMLTLAETDMSEPTPINALPLHVLHLIASKLEDGKDLVNFEQVCTRTR